MTWRYPETTTTKSASAILEYDAGMSRADAEQEAHRLVYGEQISLGDDP